MKVNTECQEFKSFINGLSVAFEIHSQKMPQPITISFKEGKKYIKILRDTGAQESVYAFINKENGDVLKPASWSAPAKHARGNIFMEDNGLSCCGPYGVAYLRR